MRVLSKWSLNLEKRFLRLDVSGDPMFKLIDEIANGKEIRRTKHRLVIISLPGIGIRKRNDFTG